MTNIGDIVKKEMAFNRFRPKKIRNVDYATVVAEIANCLYTTQHEREIVPTGVLFSNADLSNTEGVRLVEIPQEGASELRSLADGRRTFLAYMGDPAPKLVVLTRAIGDDIRLLELAGVTDGLAIKREVSGTVRLAQGTDLWLVENRNWNRKFGLLEGNYIPNYTNRRLRERRRRWLQPSFKKQNDSGADHQTDPEINRWHRNLLCRACYGGRLTVNLPPSYLCLQF